MRLRPLCTAVSAAVLSIVTALAATAVSPQQATQAGPRTARPTEPVTPLAGTRWRTALNAPADPRFVALDYPTLFVANQGSTATNPLRFQQFGTDVVAANNPAPGGPAGGLYALLPSGNVRKLFPLPVHETIPGLIDTPVGHLERGAVVEPNISEDGTRVHFAWFHDQTWKPSGGGWLNQNLSFKGSDLYTLDLTSLLADPDTDVSALPVRRLTFKEYTGPAKGNVFETAASREAYAMNPAAPGFDLARHGTCNMHMIEVRTTNGLEAVFVSDRARLANSNMPAASPNHSFDLFHAELRADGSLGPIETLLYSTTTSALSPTVLRDGFAFSYQASTESFRRWDIHAVDSGGRWSPLLGHGQADLLYHLGTLVTTQEGGDAVDHFIGVKYYNLNNAGFGQLQRIALADAGTNELVSTDAIGRQLRQATELLSLGVLAEDGPSAKVDVEGTGVYVGKLTTPRAGKFGGQYVAAHTRTSANRWIPDDDGQIGQFASRIVFRPNLDPFRPELDYDPLTGDGLATVVEDRHGRYDLLWPTPVLSFDARHGSVEQEVSAPGPDPNSPIARGLPFAEIGTSALWNTDLVPYDCVRGTNAAPYSPNHLSNSERVAFEQSFDALRYVQDTSQPCAPLAPETVIAVRLQLTSNRMDWSSLGSPGYQTDSTLSSGPNGTKETVRRLGLYDVTKQNVADQSFLARIPADVPFELHLIDRRYGMKLADTRSWHALQPREKRVDCGGCHQHTADMRIGFAGTEASLAAALDLTTATSFYSYDADCRPEHFWTNEATLPVPEWTADIWPGFSQHCGACHDGTVSADNAALAALDFVDEESAYTGTLERRYAGAVQGALGSQIFWAAYGERTDGRNNDEPSFQPNYAAGLWGFKFSAIHATNPGLCAAGDPDLAAWVYDLGLWIDNHMPRDVGNGAWPYQHDRFHPTVDFAYTNDPAGPGEIRIGVWDDRSDVQVEVFFDGVLQHTFADVPNGELVIDDGSLADDLSIRVVVTDEAGNRQMKEKTVARMREES